jgi:ATP-dependent RNA helicase DeaD
VPGQPGQPQDAADGADEGMDDGGDGPDGDAAAPAQQAPQAQHPDQRPPQGQQQPRHDHGRGQPQGQRNGHPRHGDQPGQDGQPPRDQDRRRDQRGPDPRDQEARGPDNRGPDHRGQDHRGQDHRGPDGRHQDQRGGQDQRPPRPRVDGPQRSMPSVLDRLCSFTKGILELCDPTTPTWAQARLSELLAEIGVVPIPASGQPHPDYHQVVGTAVAAGLTLGHIAIVEAPGFALRGDRGDLFPLRKAQVRLAGAERRDGAPVAPAPAAPVIQPRPEPMPAMEAAVGEAGVAEGALAQPLAEAPTAPAAERAPGEDRPREPRQNGDGRRDGRRDDRPREPRQGDDGRRDDRPREPRGDRGPGDRGGDRGPDRHQHRPEPGRSPNRVHGSEPVGEAPALPLAAQEPTELAARPKSEGFAPLGLNDQILADLAGMGYQQPTPIQAEAIPVVLTGKDVLGQAQTGTGKTAAFVLPMLQRLYAVQSPERKPVGLVLCPTRELARQVHNEFVRMAGASGARAVVIYGGTPMDDQLRALEHYPHVVIGTPGRIIDHMKRRSLDLSGLSMVVLDEADQMLDIGFWPDVNYIIGHTPPSRQILLFSATFPQEVKDMADKHMKEPAHIRIAPKQVTVEQVDQKYIAVAREKKNALLAHFIESQNPPQLVVFCRTKHQTDRVAEVLKRKNMSAGAIHGDLPQTKRERMLQQFRDGELQCLVATNVAARGLDIPTVSHVVNYDIPEMPEEYVHRIGRTARNGAKGIARTFITPEDGQFLLEIEKHIGLLLEEERIEGFSAEHGTAEVKRTIAELPASTPRILKPLVGGIRLGRRRR